MQLHRPQDDFACAPILIGCAALGAIQHVHALYFARIDTTTTAIMLACRPTVRAPLAPQHCVTPLRLYRWQCSLPSRQFFRFPSRGLCRQLVETEHESLGAPVPSGKSKRLELVMR